MHVFPIRTRARVLAGLMMTTLMILVAGYDASTANAVSAVRYGAAPGLLDGRTQTLRMDVYRPKEPGRRPAVVLVFGGGFTSGHRRDMSRYGAMYADAGYVAVAIDYRLASVGYIGRNGYRRPIQAAKNDAQAAVRYLRRHATRLHVNPRRVFISGASAGGITALAVGAQSQQVGNSGNPGYSSKVTGAVSIAGYAERAWISREDAPMLLLHSPADALIPYSRAQNTCRAAKPVNVHCTLQSFSGGHPISYTRTSLMVSRSLAWMRVRKNIRLPT